MLRQSFVLRPLWVCALVLLSAVPLSAAQAASIPISSLLVDNASLKITLTGGTGSVMFASPIVPPADIIMGTYQNPITQFSTTTSFGTASATIYSAGIGTPTPPPPSGSVNGTSINVDFSSLRASLSLPTYPTMDIPLWPLINPPTGGTYNASTGAYTLSWQDTFSVTLGKGKFAQTISGTADVMLAGKAITVVPLPAAVWLLGSGLLGIAAVVRRKTLV